MLPGLVSLKAVKGLKLYTCSLHTHVSSSVQMCVCISMPKRAVGTVVCPQLVWGRESIPSHLWVQGQRQVMCANTEDHTSAHQAAEGSESSGVRDGEGGCV